jgi:hypothetical protein
MDADEAGLERLPKRVERGRAEFRRLSNQSEAHLGISPILQGLRQSSRPDSDLWMVTFEAIREGLRETQVL